jgi:hypothetical protein
LFFSACGASHRIVPLDGEGFSGAWDQTVQPVTQKWENLRISAQPVQPSDLRSQMRRRLTVFEVSVENLSSEEVSVALQQFALLDANQVQRSPVPPFEVDRSLPDYTFYPHSITFGFGTSAYYDRSYYGYRYYDGFPARYNNDQPYLNAFQGGPIVSHAKKRGRIYFEKIEDYEGHRLELLFLADGKIRLVFPFKIISKP